MEVQIELMLRNFVPDTLLIPHPPVLCFELSLLFHIRHSPAQLLLVHLVVQVTRVPVWLLKSTRNILKSFQWARDAADRLVSLMC